MTDPASAPLAEAREFDATERLLWSIMSRLEESARHDYSRRAPQLDLPAKSCFVKELRAAVPDDDALLASPLAGPIERLEAAARTESEPALMFVRGILLELLGQTLYRLLLDNPQASALSRRWAAQGLAASEAVCNIAVQQAPGFYEDQDALYSGFVDATTPVLTQLDGLSEQIDAVFGQRFGLEFSELVSEFSAELLSRCIELGMTRRQVVCHLTAALMGS